MSDRRHGLFRLGAIGIALGLASGLLLMHGLDARAAGEGHGLMASPSRLVSEVDALAGVAVDGPVVTSAGVHHAMTHLCIAVLNAVGFALLALLALGRLRGQIGTPVSIRQVAAPDSRSVRRRAPPPVPRIALCVSLS